MYHLTNITSQSDRMGVFLPAGTIWLVRSSDAGVHVHYTEISPTRRSRLHTAKLSRPPVSKPQAIQRVRRKLPFKMAKKAKSRVMIVRLLSMAATGYFYTVKRLRTATPMSLLKYDPISMPTPFSSFGERCFSWSRRRRGNEPAHSRYTNTICNNTDITINGVHGGIRLGLEDHMDELYIINLQSLRPIVRDKALARRTVPQRRKESEGFDGRDLVVYSIKREQTLRKCIPLHDSTHINIQFTSKKTNLDG
ncbi:ribosomal protein L33 [Colletotrichum lupini]|uniref:Large ribosomal subunit protein bL33m n=1 Tax=Colletotrichum lupini TaxID=145971 RepID=A0A9Q8SBW8_9PEZI|nr:ribosomal protein L33 [Colletotrichum lupini]UQC73667.1 ribosomal protein L33 [Colletotrichum lupini]